MFLISTISQTKNNFYPKARLVNYWYVIMNTHHTFFLKNRNFWCNISINFILCTPIVAFNLVGVQS